jgi:hypothetical protein
VTGPAAVGEMVVNAAGNADTNPVETHTGKEAVTGRRETPEDVAVPVEPGHAVAVLVAVAAAVGFAAVAAAVAVPAAVVEEMMSARKMGRQSALKTDHPAVHHYCL